MGGGLADARCMACSSRVEALRRKSCGETWAIERRSRSVLSMLGRTWPVSEDVEARRRRRCISETHSRVAGHYTGRVPCQASVTRAELLFLCQKSGPAWQERGCRAPGQGLSSPGFSIATLVDFSSLIFRSLTTRLRHCEYFVWCLQQFEGVSLVRLIASQRPSLFSSPPCHPPGKLPRQQRRPSPSLDDLVPLGALALA